MAATELNQSHHLHKESNSLLNLNLVAATHSHNGKGLMWQSMAEKGHITETLKLPDLQRSGNTPAPVLDANGIISGSATPAAVPGHAQTLASLIPKKQIYDKTVARIENLKNATGTRPTVDGTPSVPTLAEVQGIKNLEFRIQSASSEVRAAVEAQLQSLREKYPSWNFGAKYGE